LSDFEQRVAQHDESALYGVDLRTIMVNVTPRCNQSCRHCHLSCSPTRAELMSEDVMSRIAEIAEETRPALVDITGGAPEFHPGLVGFIGRLTEAGHRVQIRTNLTVLAESRFTGLPALFAAHRVDLLASMPCYTDRNVRAVRGDGVRDASIEVMRRLNDLGYGVDGSGLRLYLAYNPAGATLPEAQDSLEALFRNELADRFGVEFTGLRTITNMPVGRYRDWLVGQGAYDRYVRALEMSFNPDTLPHLMCRHQVEIAWDGRLYDCDFNLAEDAPLAEAVWDFNANALAERRIIHGAHCFGCAAGAGSS
jgi:radical SAM/Cys-rich protein